MNKLEKNQILNRLSAAKLKLNYKITSNLIFNKMIKIIN